MMYNTFNNRFHMSVLSYNRRTRSITIPASKSDPFQTGITIPLPNSIPRDVNPISHLDNYLNKFPASLNQPLFQLRGVSHFSKKVVFGTHLTNTLQSLSLHASGFSGHSFRRGAATWAKSVGVSNGMIKVLGHWAGDSFKRYIDNADNLCQFRSRLFQSRSTLLSTGITHNIWSAN